VSPPKTSPKPHGWAFQPTSYAARCFLEFDLVPAPLAHSVLFPQPSHSTFSPAAHRKLRFLFGSRGLRARAKPLEPMPGRPALPNDIKELMPLVRTGKLFEVQKWIAAGKRTMPPEPYWTSPLRVAVQTGFHSMIELLVQQGVDQHELDYMLENAVWNGNFDVIKLLIQYGANLHAVDFEDVCRTGHPFIIQYFLDNGIDAETNQPFARALCYPKRRFLGIYMRYRNKVPSFKRQLNLALKYHARAGNLKWVSLLMWAGGDPHLRLPEIGEKPNRKEDTSALEDAVFGQRYDIVDKIGIDSERDNVNRMFETACLLGHTKMIEKLLAVGADPKGAKGSNEPMDKAISRLCFDMEERYGFRSETKAKEALAGIVSLAKLGARWESRDWHLRHLRRLLCHFEPSMTETIVKTFHEHQVCASDVLLKLIRTAKMKTLLGFRYASLIALLKAKTGQPQSTAG
jgi:hypothetical protein